MGDVIFRRARKTAQSDYQLRHVGPSVRPSACNNSVPLWTDFHEILVFENFSKSVEKIQVSLQSKKNNGTLHEDQYTLLIISRSVLLRMRNVSGESCKKIKTHSLCSVTFSFPKIVL